MRKRTLVLFPVLLIALGIASWLSIWIGAASLVNQPSLAATFRAVLSTDTSQPLVALVHSRIPRTVNALLTGAALAAAGCAMQGLTRNPLAEPGYLGINAGAAMFVVLGLTVGVAGSTLSIAVLAVGGAFVTALTVYVLAGRGVTSASPAAALKLILVGAAVLALANAVISAMMLTNTGTLEEFRIWQVGGISRSSLADAGLLLPFFAVGLALLLVNTRTLNAFALGEDLAQGLGLNLPLRRTLVILGITLCAGASVALTGPIGFVGLLVPQLLRRLVGADFAVLLPACVLGGPLLVLVADVCGRIILPPSEVQVGVMMAVLGTPLFLVMLRKATGGVL